MGPKMHLPWYDNIHFNVTSFEDGRTNITVKIYRETTIVLLWNKKIIHQASNAFFDTWKYGCSSQDEICYLLCLYTYCKPFFSSAMSLWKCVVLFLWLSGYICKGPLLTSSFLYQYILFLRTNFIRLTRLSSFWKIRR